MIAVDRIRQYIASRKSSNSRTTATASSTVEDSNGSRRNHSRSPSSSSSASTSRRSIRPARSSPAAPTRRRLQRGWWPDAQKRAERSFKAMEDLREETFVITEGNLEWVIEETKETLEPQCYLVLPSEITNNKTCQHSISNECAICMAEYDLGDVVICSKTCPHAFHQDCILDWVSRENTDCPVCRAVFYDPSRLQNNSDTNGDETPDDGNDNDTNIRRRRSRSNTADTDVLSEYDSGERSRGTSFDGGDNNNINNRLLESVVENDVVESSVA